MKCGVNSFILFLTLSKVVCAGIQVINIISNKANRRISKQVFQHNAELLNFPKNKMLNFPKNEHFLPPIRTCAYQGVRNVRFSEILACFLFLKHPFWDLSFCIITDDINDLNAFDDTIFCLYRTTCTCALRVEQQILNWTNLDCVIADDCIWYEHEHVHWQVDDWVTLFCEVKM